MLQIKELLRCFIAYQKDDGVKLLILKVSPLRWSNLDFRYLLVLKYKWIIYSLPHSHPPKKNIDFWFELVVV